jgi:hypothetical protein
VFELFLLPTAATAQHVIRYAAETPTTFYNTRYNMSLLTTTTTGTFISGDGENTRLVNDIDIFAGGD